MFNNSGYFLFHSVRDSTVVRMDRNFRFFSCYVQQFFSLFFVKVTWLRNVKRLQKCLLTELLLTPNSPLFSVSVAFNLNNVYFSLYLSWRKEPVHESLGMEILCARYANPSGSEKKPLAQCNNSLPSEKRLLKSMSIKCRSGDWKKSEPSLKSMESQKKGD